MKRFILSLVTLVTVVMSLTACGTVELPEKIVNDTVYINQDGVIDYYMTSTFDKEYYNVDELSTMAKDEVSDYIKANSLSSDAITVAGVNLVVNNGTNVVVKYNFADSSVGEKFLTTDLFYGTIAAAVQKNLGLNEKLISVKDGSEVTKEELLKKNERNIFVTDLKACIYCPKDILYVSDNASYINGYVDATNATGTVIIVTK